MFTRTILNTPVGFHDVLDATILEGMSAGRSAAVVSNHSDTLPIVRTTSKYHLPHQPFSQVYLTLIKEIQSIVGPRITFNNALVELYTDQYRKMGYHSDQALDLEDDSYICLFSCYRDTGGGLRVLRVKNKDTGEVKDIVLEDNSIVVFSTEDNRKYVHKISLGEKKNNPWVGVTFRLSKTHVGFLDGVPMIGDIQLTQATDEQCQEFYKLKHSENSVDYEQPELNYTLSEGDLLQPLDYRTGVVTGVETEESVAVA
jgi:hypothetical protein